MRVECFQNPSSGARRISEWPFVPQSDTFCPYGSPFIRVKSDPEPIMVLGPESRPQISAQLRAAVPGGSRCL